MLYRRLVLVFVMFLFHLPLAAQQAYPQRCLIPLWYGANLHYLPAGTQQRVAPLTVRMQGIEHDLAYLAEALPHQREGICALARRQQILHRQMHNALWDDSKLSGLEVGILRYDLWRQERALTEFWETARLPKRARLSIAPASLRRVSRSILDFSGSTRWTVPPPPPVQKNPASARVRPRQTYHYYQPRQ